VWTLKPTAVKVIGRRWKPVGETHGIGARGASNSKGYYKLNRQG
jgi:hypothetical protein